MIKIGNIDFTDEKYIIDIRDKSQVIKARVVMPDDAVYGKYLMKKDDIQFSFEYDSLVSFVRGDYIEYDGARFVLDDENSSVQENTQRFVYSLVFQADYMLLKNTQMYYVRQNLKEVSWSLTSDASSFIKIVVDNANRYFNTTDWQVGAVEPTGMKYINFDSTNVLDALTQIAEQFDAEWYITGKTINLVNKLSYGSEIDFESEVSVVSMARSEGENSTKFNRIVALGSTRNIPANYRQTTPTEGMDAIYQKRLRIPASKGDIIDAYPNMSPEEVVEGSVIFDDVYPQRTGIMSDITTKEYTDTDEDTGVVTKWNAYRYKDTGLSFKESYILPGQELRIVFQSGKPNGMDFAVKFNPDGYPETDARSQVFEIVRSEDYGAKLPNDVIKPENGDKYILYGFDIQLVSDQYVPAAEQELYDKALEWLKNNLKDKSVYTCPSIINHFAENSMDLEVGQKVRLVNGRFENGYRSSRIMGFEKKLYNIYEATYTVGDNAVYSRLANIEKDIEELKYAGQVYQNTGGGSVYLIKQFDTTTPTDFNAYSAKASNARFLKRDQEDSALKKITFADGIDVKKGAVSNMFGNESFTSGQFGSGFRMWQADNGQSYAELDNLMVRREMIINTLTIAEIKSVGGQILVSLANMYVTKVEERSDSYRCFFETDNGTIPNQFAVDDQAICRKFNGQGLKYYWRRVLSIGSDYIDLSKVDRDGSSIPAEGDEIIQFGNRTNTARQSAIMISAYGSDSPSIKQYAGINTYNMTGKEVTVISPSGNKFTGEFKISTNGTTSIVYKDRGTFSNVTTYYLNDRVSYNGAYWVCIAPEGQSTSETPSVTALYWRQDTTSQGDINNAIDNIEIGGTNLLSGTSSFAVGDIAPNYLGWGVAQSDNFRGNTILKMAAPYQGFRFPNFPDNKLPYECTLSFYARVDSGSTPLVSVTQSGFSITVNSTEWKQYSIVLPAGTMVNNAGRNGILETWNSNPIYLSSIKLERGNKATEWNPSNQDIQNSINNAQNTANNAVQRITVAESNITVLQNEIKQTVKQSDFNSLQGRVSTAESNITQQSNQIALTVEKVDKKNAAYKSYTSASTDHPNVPYSKGDIWITFDGTIKQAQNTRLTGTFVSSDWVDTTKYTDDSAINNLQFGSSNLINGSKAIKLNASSSTHNYVSSAIYLKPDTEYSIRIGKITNLAGNATSYGITFYDSVNNRHLISIVYFTQTNLTATVKTASNFTAGNYYVLFYAGSPGSTVNNSVLYDEVMIVEGNKGPTTWSPSNADVQAGIDNAQSTADSKNRTFYSDTQPSTPSGGFKVGDLWYKINTIDGCYETYRWNGSTWTIINVNVSKAKQVITDSSITNLVEKTGINSLGNGETLWSKINQTADQISLEIGKIQIGSRNYVLGSKTLTQGAGSNNFTFLRLNLSEGLQSNTEYTFSVGKSEILSGTTVADYSVLIYNTSTNQGGAGFVLPVSADRQSYVFKTGSLPNSGYSLLLYTGRSGSSANRAMKWTEVKLEKANKASDWSPAPEDNATKEEIKSSLTLDKNGISLFGKTIELTGQTIADAITIGGDLKVGSRTGLSALEVLQNGTFYAKGSSGTNQSLVIDSGTQSIEIVSPYSASWNEDGGSTPSGKSTVKISSQTGGVEVRNDSYDASIVSTNGIFANKAGQSAFPLGNPSRASVVGLGFGNMAKYSYGDYFIAGVIGTASNSNANPAPAYGGWFSSLKANGFIMSMQTITSSATTNTNLNKTTSFVLSNSSVMQNVYLPNDAYPGTVIWLKQWWTGYMRVRARSPQELYDDSSVNDYVDIGEGQIGMCIYIGEWTNSSNVTRGIWMFSKFKF